MFKKIFVLGTFSLFVAYSAFAQDTWTLERCIDYAQKNSISVKQSQIQIESSNLTEQQLKANRRPGLTASSNLGSNLGRSINPASNGFDVGFTGFNSLSLNAGGVVYQGGQINNSIKQNNFNREAAKADLEQSIMNISLSVASSYLRILLGEEQVSAAKKRVEQSQQQMDQVKKLITAGARPKNDIFEFIAQLSRNEQTLVTAQNSVDLEYLNLKQLLELDPESPFKIDKPTVKVPTENGVEGLTMKAVYQQAYSRQPQITAGEMRLKSLQMQSDIERRTYRPSVSWYAGLSTNYSSYGAQDTRKDLVLATNTQNVLINSVPSKIESAYAYYPTTKEYFYITKKNLGGNFGINISVPIYDRGLTSIAVQRARLNVESQQLTNQRTNQQLKVDIQNAIASAKAAKKQLEASEKTFDAAKNAYDNANKKYEVGSANSFELTTARNNMDTAERDFIIAKYDYIFRLKIVDFYQGRKITLNEK